MATKRRVFYSFHYAADSWRASQVRNIGAVEGNRTATDNDWERIKRGGDQAIKRWIRDQMAGRSCTVVLVGSNTANRKWINYEISESWNSGMGIVGIHIHGLQDQSMKVAIRGRNPFDYVFFTGTKKALSAVVKCYDPVGLSSQQKYGWIQDKLSDVIEEAIRIRQANG